MTLDEIRNRAEELAKKYNPEGVVPFPYQKIERDYSELIIFTWDKFPSADHAALTFDKKTKTFVIMVNKNISQAKQNFIVAHQLGHYFLHREMIQNNADFLIEGELLMNSNFELPVIETETEKKKQMEATIFAASLLMPSELVIQLWESLKDIKECAHVFGVPVVMMVLRLENLGLLE
jgi:Zn-dependent peptidase ImmA (M78 family)